MKIGSMRDVLLTDARNEFLLHCQLANFDPATLDAYRDVLGSFIRFTGDRLVRELTPDHVRTYIHTFDDYPGKSKEHVFRLEINHYVVIHTWIRWMHAQRFINESYGSNAKPLDTRGACGAIILDSPDTFENIIGVNGRVAQR